MEKRAEDIELHDAVLRALHVDYGSGSVRIGLDYYKSEHATARSSAILCFSGVRYFSHSCDLDTLQRHAIAGNVGYCRAGETEGVTYIYPVDGMIEVRYKKLECIPE